MADKYYLDKSGLNFFWGKVKDWIVTKHYLTYDSQGLTDEERAQARTNIGAAALASPVFTGTPKTVAITSTSATNAIADKQYVDNVVASASYALPTATSSVLGGVKIGNYITVVSDGTVSVNAATTNAFGVVKLSDMISDSASDKSTTAATPNAVINYVSTQVASLFSYGGSTNFSSLPSPSASTINKVYNVTDSFTTTSDFVEGAGNVYPAGTNIIGVDLGSGGSHSYKYDVTTGFLDLSDFPNTAITDAEISAIVV